MILSRVIVKLAYQLEGSEGYQSSKKRVWKLLEDPYARERPYFDNFMILLVLASVTLLVYEVRHDLGRFVDGFELLVVTIFIAEYLLRLWVYNDSRLIIIEHYERAEFLGRPFRLLPALKDALGRKWEYLTSPPAIIDLLAILPSFRSLPVLRLFVLFRLFKLFRYTRSINEFVKILSDKRFELATLVLFLSAVVFAGAAVIYFFEAGKNPQINGFFDGIYWALITLTTVGYGDITPQTTEGRFVSMALVLCGIGFVAFTTSIIVAALTEKMPEVRERRVLAEVGRRGGYIIICGFGRVGEMVAAKLTQDKERFVVVDSHEGRIGIAKRNGYLALQGDAAETRILESLGVSRTARKVLCLTGDDVVNVYITLTARFLNPQIEIISRANHLNTVGKLIKAGANHTLNPFGLAGMIAAEYIGHPVAFEAIFGMLSGEREIEMEAMRVVESGPLDGLSIGDIDFRAHRLILFGVVCREGDPRLKEGGLIYGMPTMHFHFNPRPEFVLKREDILILFGHQYSLFHFKQGME